MAEKMVFPIGFDLESGVKEAEAKAKDMMERIKKAIKEGEAVKIKPVVKEDEAVESISNIKEAMKSLQEEWNGMDFKAKFSKEGGPSKDAQDMMEKYRKLSEALETYGRTLEKIVAIDKKNTDEQVRYWKKVEDEHRKYLKRVEDEQRRFDQREMANTRKNYAERQRMYDQLFGKYDIKGVSVGFDAGSSKGLGNSIKELNEIEARLREIDALYARINATGAAAKDDGSASKRVIGLLQERNALEQRRTELTRTASEAAKRLTKDEEASQKHLLALEKQRIKEEEAANRKRQQMLKARYAARVQEKNALMANIADLRKQRAALSAQEDTISKINAKLAVYNRMLQTTAIGSEKFNRITANIQRLSDKLSDVSGERKKAKEINRVTDAYKTQSTYIERLLQRMALYASFRVVGNFMKQVREITAQFELQRISLGAIIQDQTRANALFSEIKQFALKSPISIMDFTKYTKQVAAYRIETDKLFDTTKRLADVSVGLGVDMGRLVLAYGQVKAASYLRAAEIRQFTEAGIPLLELLSEKFQELNGRAVTTEEVMDMVSKRMVSFEMVADIFKDMTDKGGMFYNMQEKQGNTLYGMWAKLGDAASMMYDEIGNTESVRNALEGVIQLITWLMGSWKSMAKVAIASVAYMGIYQLWLKKLTVSKRSAMLATERLEYAERKLNVVNARSGRLAQFNARMMLSSAKASQKAAAATNLFTRSIQRMKAALLANWATALLALVGFIVERIINAVNKAKELENALKDIDVENKTEQEKSVRNFEALANSAVNAADGSKRQRDALDELKRTYGKIIPLEKLSINNLRELNGNYDSLTNSVRQYIQEQMKQKAVDTVLNKYGKDILENERNVAEYLEGMGLSYDRAQAFLEEYKRLVEYGSTDLYENVVNSFKAIGIELDKETDEFQKKAQKLYLFHRMGAGKWGFSIYDYAKMEELTDLYVNQEKDLKSLETRYDSAGTTLGEYKKYVDELNKSVEKATYNIRDKEGKVTGLNISTYLGRQAQNNRTIKEMGRILQEVLGDAWDDGFSNFVESVNSGQANVISKLDFGKIFEAAKKKGGNELYHLVEEFQRMYNDIVPSDSVVNALRDKLYELSKGVKGGMDSMRQYTLADGTGLKEHLDVVNDDIEKLHAKIYKYNKFIKRFGSKGVAKLKAQGIDVKELEAEEAALKSYAEAVKYYLEEKEKKGGGADKRLQTLREIADKMAQINKEYREQLKYQGETEAFATTENMFADTFAEMKSVMKALEKEYKFKFQLPKLETPKTAKDVEMWYKAVISEIKRLNIKNPEKVLIELGFNAKKVRIDEIQRQVEDQLTRLSDNIAKSKAAKGFFDKVFADTKDYDLAMDVTVGVYGNVGNELKNQIAEQIRYATSEQEGGVFVDIDISGAIDPKTLDVNYKALREAIKKFEDAGGKIPDDQKKVLDSILKNGEEYNKAQIEKWNEALSKNRDFAQQYVDIWRETDNEIRAIRAKVASGEIGADTGEKYIQAQQKKRADVEAKLEWEMFKDMPMYVQMFDNLDKASRKALANMRDKLVELQSSWGKEDDPLRLKELQSRLNDIDTQLATKNPFRLLRDSIAEYKDARDSLKEEPAEVRVENARKRVEQAERGSYEEDVAKDELAVEERRLAIIKQVTADKGVQLGYEKQIANMIAEAEVQQATAKANLVSAEERYREIEEEKGTIDQSDEAAVAEWNAKLAAQGQIVVLMQREYTIANNTVKSFQKQANAGKKLKDNINKTVQIASKWASDADSLAGTLGDVKDLLGISSDSAAGIVFDSAIEGLENFSKLMNVIIGLQTIYNIICESNPWLAIAAAILAVFSIIGSLIKNDRVAAANAEIEKQEKIIKRLEREYERLDGLTDKVFGGEYITNFQKRLVNLEAQYDATLKKIEAEKSKGKQADKDKLEELEDEAEDTMEKIEELQGEVSERMLGTSLESAAQSFAESWLDAYLSFSDTAEAMKEKYREMMKSFIVQNVLARAVQQMLKPLFDMIDKAAESDNRIDDAEIEAIAEKASSIIGGIDGSLTALMDALMNRIPELRDLYDSGDLTGISRDIATASEESINGLAVGINTQNFYISRIHANVAMLMANLDSGSIRFSLSDATLEALDRHLSYLPVIAQKTAETVNRCERAAVACENTLDLLSKVIKPEGTSSSYRMYVS